MNSKRGGLTFKAGGQSYTFAFTTNAMAAYEDETGEEFLEAIGTLAVRPKVKRVRALFWAGLSPFHNLSQEESGLVMDELGFKNAAQMIGEATERAFPEAEAEAEAGNGKTKAA